MTSHPDGTLGPVNPAFLLTQVGTLAASLFAQRLETLGLTPPHAGLLRAVAASPGRSQKAVATQLGLLPSKLVSLVDDLEREGLVERRRHSTDRRNHALHLTETGAALLRRVGQLSREHNDTLLAPLDVSERIVLGDLLARLAAHHGLTHGVHPGYRTLGA